MRKIILFLLFAFLSVSLASWGQRENNEGDTIEVSGEISIKGNTPFEFVSLITPKGLIYILEGPKSKELQKKQGKGTVTIQGRILRKNPSLGVEASIEVLSYQF